MNPSPYGGRYNALWPVIPDPWGAFTRAWAAIGMTQLMYHNLSVAIGGGRKGRKRQLATWEVASMMGALFWNQLRDLP